MRRGFTLVELLVTLAIMSVLAAAVFPLAEMSIRRSKEKELKQALWDIRAAIDAYKKAGDEGQLLRRADESGYPPDLRTLVDGAPNMKSADGRKIYFLRRIPRDPFYAEPRDPPEKTWGLRSYESPADAPRAGKDVFDVRSLAAGTGLNGVPYREW